MYTQNHPLIMLFLIYFSKESRLDILYSLPFFL